jgi:hypothetical protein
VPRALFSNIKLVSPTFFESVPIFVKDYSSSGIILFRYPFSSAIPNSVVLEHSDFHKFNTRNSNKLAVLNFTLNRTGISFLAKSIVISTTKFLKT